MKAFFGALVLSLVSVVIGIFASTEIHQMALAVGGSNPAPSTAPDVASAPRGEKMKRPVIYAEQGAMQQSPQSGTGI